LEKTKKKQGNKTRQSNIKKQPIEIDYDKLADAIVKAQNKAKEIELEEQEKLRQEKQKEWQNNLKQKEITEKTKCKFLIKIRNFFFGLWQLLFLKRDGIRADKATIALTKLSLSGLFGFLKWALYLFTFIWIIYAFISVANTNIVFDFKLEFILYSLFAFLLARIIRIAMFEMENMTDREYLFAILSASTSFFALILALIALFN
jgi:cation transport ATPase